MATAAAAAGYPFVPPPTTFEKSEREGRGRFAATEILTAEDACKWRKLNSLYGAEGWDDAAAALSWDSAGIPEHIRRALDDAWRIEVARMARAHQEEQADLARQESKRKRREQRRAAVRPVNQFIRSQGLSIVHESAVPKQCDEATAANPLSQQYTYRPTRKPRRSSRPSPPPPPAELVAAAAAKGIAIVPAHKQTRQPHAYAGGAAAEAEAALQLAALDPAVAAAIAAKFVAAPTKPAAAAATVASSFAQAQQAAQQAEAQQAEQLAAYYKEVKAYVNVKREAKKLGSLSKASRAALRELCKYHYKDPGPREKGFEGTALCAPWHANYYDASKHPASEDTDSD